MLLNESRKDKLDDHYEVPYRIIKILNNVNIELQISPQEARIVHMNRVKHAFLRHT